MRDCQRGMGSDRARRLIAAALLLVAAPAGALAAGADVPVVPTETEIVISVPEGQPPDDPVRRVNEASFSATQKLDKAVFGPVALGYKHVVPSPVRTGLRHFFANLSEPIVFTAFMLELKPGKAAETAGRFGVNSTIGLAGFLDVARKKPFNLPYRANGFADMLGYYGVHGGPYFYVPLFGNTTLRDMIGNSIDQLLLPFAVGKPFDEPAFALPVTAISLLDGRAEYEPQMRKLRAAANPYEATRDYYLATRQAEIDGLHSRKRHKPRPPAIHALEPDGDMAPPTGKAAVAPATSDAGP